MKINNYKNIKLNKDLILRKEVLIGGAILTTAATAAITYRVVSKAKNSNTKENEIANEAKSIDEEVTIQNEDLSKIINELESVSNKIVELSKTQEQLDTLKKEKMVLKNTFTISPCKK